MGVVFDNLPGEAQRLLSLLVGELQAADVVLPMNTATPPAPNAYVSPGSVPVFDGPALIVNVGLIRQGDPRGSQTNVQLPDELVITVQFIVTLIRTTPSVDDSGTAAPPSVIGQAAVAAISDQTAVWNALVSIWADYSFTDMGDGFSITGIESIGPEGGLIATRATIEVGAT